MKNYLLIQNGGPTKLRWEYQFEMASDEMAISYAENIAKSERVNLTVFGEGSALAEFTVGFVEVKSRRLP